MNWNWAVIIDSLPQLLEGAVLTLELVGISVLIGAIFSIPLALMRLSGNPLLSNLTLAYSFFFRGTPLLVQLFLFYCGLAQFDGAPGQVGDAAQTVEQGELAVDV